MHPPLGLLNDVQGFNAALELVRHAGVVGAGSLLVLELGGGQLALERFFLFWATRKLGYLVAAGRQAP